jgi:Zn-dependent metalloprotease
VDDAEDAEVIWHEYGHAIQDNQVPGFGSTLEAGAMGEGFGDYLAGSLGAPLSGGFQDTCLMEWDATSYMNVLPSPESPSCLRRLDSAKIYPKDIVGEVHNDGEIWSAALWRIRGVLGPEKADKLIIQHHFLLARDSSFNTAANALVTTAKNLNLGFAELTSIRDILLARGFTVTVQ